MRQEQYKKAMEATKYEDFASCFDSGCTRCSLSKHDNRPVIYRGNTKSKILLLAEAPGAKEDQLGKPFTGPAGQLLDRIFYAIGLDTNEDMLLTNVVYCRPVASQYSGKQNYTPKKEQTVRCWPFTLHAIKILEPKIIIACGRTALCALFDDNSLRMSDWEGRWNKNIFCILHPAAILHQSFDEELQQQTKARVWRYMQLFRDTYKDKL